MTNLMTQNKVSEEVLLAVPEPEFTKTWHPLSHKKIITAVALACQELKLTIGRKEYGATKDMAKMFGVWEIENGHTDFNFSIGIRNAIDKRVSIGVCAGKRTFVCDNLMFSSDFVVFRKHTGQLSVDELMIIAREAVKTIIPELEELHKWHEALRAIHLTAAESALLTVAAMRENLFPNSKYPEFHDLYYGSTSKYSPTLHGWHGAITEIYGDRPLTWLHEDNVKLKRFIDYESPVLLEQGSIYQQSHQVDFAKIETDGKEKDIERRNSIKAEFRVKSKNIREIAQGELKEEKIKKVNSKAKAKTKTADTGDLRTSKAKKKAKPSPKVKKSSPKKKPTPVKPSPKAAKKTRS